MNFDESDGGPDAARDDSDIALQVEALVVSYHCVGAQIDRFQPDFSLDLRIKQTI